jgi:KUP system potassium uptake protein
LPFINFGIQQTYNSHLFDRLIKPLLFFFEYSLPIYTFGLAMSESNSEENKSKKYLAGLSLAAIGIVYGDIGTSPLYAFRESFHDEYGLAVSHANVLGILSLIFWALILVITIKYLVFVLRADNDGEGGIIALTALITPSGDGEGSTLRRWLVLAGLFGAALLYGDSMITPAISVLSAIEGLKVATPLFEPYVIPITIGILLGLFIFQSQGTAGLGMIFGPITTVWFVVLGILGVSQIIQAPQVFEALNPLHGVEFFMRNGISGFFVLGSVFLVVTGGEALYADIGHFGLLPIRLTWFGIVLPCLLLNYFGQGALLLTTPEAVENPFFLMGPEWALYPMVIIATMATIIASQAVISGAFSLTRQAVQLGYIPRMKIEQTSAREVGQIYMPAINWILMIACIGLVLGFGSSSNLAAAYGVGVTTDMVFTTLLFAVVMRVRWNWSLPAVAALTVFFLIIDLAFWGANIIKVPQGGWFPLVVAGLIFILMTTWKKGRTILYNHIKSDELPLEDLINDVSAHTNVKESEIKRVSGTAVYMYSNPDGCPPALLNNIKHNKVIHDEVVLLSVKITEDKPRVPRGEQIEVESLGSGFFRVIITGGFTQSIDVPNLLEKVEKEEHDFAFDMEKTTYFLGKQRILPSDSEFSKMSKWRDHLFGIMVRNQQQATTYFNLPSNRVVEMGSQVEL